MLYIYKIYCIKYDYYNVRHTSPLFDTKVHIDIVKNIIMHVYIWYK